MSIRAVPYGRHALILPPLPARLAGRWRRARTWLVSRPAAVSSWLDRNDGVLDEAVRAFHRVFWPGAGGVLVLCTALGSVG